MTMPISPIIIQRRHAELGRIRLGARNADKGFPMKLDSFRFTSPSETYINDLALIYGGKPRAWDNDGKPEFEVFTNAKSIPVIVIKGGLSQWMETYVGKNLAHRCDGEVSPDGVRCNVDEFVTDSKGRKIYVHRDAKPTTHLSVMLPELDSGTGAWHMVTKGWNAAAEIPAVAELAQFVGELVPARLHLIERRSVKDGETRRFVVPVLDLHIGRDRLREIVAEKSGMAALPAGDTPALGGGTAAALPSGATSTDDVTLPTIDDIQAAVSIDVVFNIHRFLTAHEAMTPALDAACKARREQLEGQDAGPDADGAYAAEVVDEDAIAAADMAWQQVLAEAGKQGLDLTQTKDAYTRFSNGLDAGDATAQQLELFKGYLQAGQQVSA